MTKSLKLNEREKMFQAPGDYKVQVIDSQTRKYNDKATGEKCLIVEFYGKCDHGEDWGAVFVNNNITSSGVSNKDKFLHLLQQCGIPNMYSILPAIQTGQFSLNFAVKENDEGKLEVKFVNAPKNYITMDEYANLDAEFFGINNANKAMEYANAGQQARQMPVKPQYQQYQKPMPVLRQPPQLLSANPQADNIPF